MDDLSVYVEKLDVGCKYAAMILCEGMDVKLREAALSGRLPCCLLDASMICTLFQVLVAANKAVSNSLNNQMITKNIYTETMYSLSPTRNISESLRTFGTKNDSKGTLVLFIGDNDDFTQQIEQLHQLVDNSLMPLDKLQDITDKNKIKNFYDITDEELNISSFESAILTAMAVSQTS